jgi:K+-sensing histidine kinase KdpD
MVYFFVRYRTRFERNKRIKLEKIIKEKTFELENTIEERDNSLLKLENSESKLSSLVVVQNKILNLVLHDLKSPLLFLNMLSKDAVNQFKEDDIPATKKSLKSLSNGINEVVNFTNTFFEWIYFQRKGLKPVIEIVNLPKIFSEMEFLFRSMKSNNQFSFISEKINIKTDENILITILRNIIDNANKNTKNGQINMKGELIDKFVVITIWDNSSGFTEESLVKIKKAFDKSSSVDELDGFGYKIIIELLFLIQGDLKIANGENGSIVTISIPQDVF